MIIFVLFLCLGPLVARIGNKITIVGIVSATAFDTTGSGRCLTGSLSISLPRCFGKREREREKLDDARLGKFRLGEVSLGYASIG